MNVLVSENLKRLDHCAVAFPHGNNLEVLTTLMSNAYMGWESCTFAQAEEAANYGIAAVGMDTDIPLSERLSMQLFAYTSSNTTTVPLMTAQQYYNNIYNTPLLYPSGNITYCNIWVHNLLDRCKITDYATGGCNAELAQYESGKFPLWKECDFSAAQFYANSGKATIAIGAGHIAAVTPNNISNTGSIPTDIGQVWISQSGSSCFYGKTLSYGWSSSLRPQIKFFFYNK